MNTLLANAEIPGLFEGDEFVTLMTACREGARRDNLILDTEDEIRQWLSAQIARNVRSVYFQ